MTVAEMRNRMSNREYVKWVAWHTLRAQQEEIAGKRMRR